MPPIIDRLTSLVLVVVSMIDQRAESCHQMMRSYGVVGCITIRGMLVVSGREQLQNVEVRQIALAASGEQPLEYRAIQSEVCKKSHNFALFFEREIG